MVASNYPTANQKWGGETMNRNMLLVALTVLVSGCMARDFNGDRQYENLSYQEYKDRVGVGSFDPKGGSGIYFRTHSTRDGYDSWWRLQIGPENFTRLLDGMSTHMEIPESASHNPRRVGQTKKAATDDVSFPDNWPKPDTLPPEWWKLCSEGEGIRCTRWELQVGDRTTDGRAKGWYWLYDSNSGTLWIWEWNHQWFDLGSDGAG